MKVKKFSDFKSAGQRVKFLLENVPQSIESDKMMVAIYWLNEIQEQVNNLSAHDFIMMVGNSKVTSAGTIIRQRQLIQKNNELLRPNHYGNRKKIEKPNYFIVRQKD